MKKIILVLFVLLLTAGCFNNVYNQETARPGAALDNFGQADIIGRMTDINNVSSPGLKPAGIESQQNLTSEFNGAIIKTNFGDVSFKFYAEESPATVNNFLNLAQSGFYNGTKFHRVIKDFMIQGGDPLSKDDDWSNDGRGGPGYQFQDEINSHKLVKGSLAMANAGPDTNGSQFFIVTAESTPWLDGKHTNFGRVVEGTDIVERIASVATGSPDIPTADVLVKRVRTLP